MIHVDNHEIEMNGSFKRLLKEVAFALHTITNAVEQELDDVEYEEVIAHFMAELVALKKFAPTNNNVVPEDLELDFFKQLEDYRSHHGNDPDWVEYNSGNPFKNKKNPIQSSLKGFIMDPRAQEEFFDDKKKGKK